MPVAEFHRVNLPLSSGVIRELWRSGKLDLSSAGRHRDANRAGAAPERGSVIRLRALPRLLCQRLLQEWQAVVHDWLAVCDEDVIYVQVQERSERRQVPLVPPAAALVGIERCIPKTQFAVADVYDGVAKREGACRRDLDWLLRTRRSADRVEPC